MHVLHLSWEHPPRLYGGLGRHVEGLTAALAEAGDQVTVVTPALDPEHGLEPPPGTVAVLRGADPGPRLPADRWIAATIDANVAMARRVLEVGLRPDLLHAHDWMAGHALAVLAAALDLPVVATVHATERGRHQGHLPPGISGWIDDRERQLVAGADAVVTCSGHVRDHVIAHLDADAATTAVIPNGVDLRRWTDVVPRPPGPRPRVVYAGRLEHEKGVGVLLEATDGLDVEVVIAGRGSQGPALRRAAHARVRFDGHLAQRQLAALLSSASVAVVPSLYEPFGLAAVEAMAAGVPVVASAVGGLLDVVTPEAGVLVPPDDPWALQQAILRILGDADGARRLVAGGRLRAEELSWRRSAALHRSVYEGLCGSSVGPPPPLTPP